MKTCSQQRFMLSSGEMGIETNLLVGKTERIQFHAIRMLSSFQMHIDVNIINILKSYYTLYEKPVSYEIKIGINEHVFTVSGIRLYAGISTPSFFQTFSIAHVLTLHPQSAVIKCCMNKALMPVHDFLMSLVKSWYWFIVSAVWRDICQSGELLPFHIHSRATLQEFCPIQFVYCHV